MFFEMRFDLGTLDSGERSLPFGLLVTCAIEMAIVLLCCFLLKLNFDSCKKKKLYFIV